MSKIKVFNCGEYGHFAQHFLREHDNTNITKKVSKTTKWKICWIWTVLLSAKNVQ